MPSATPIPAEERFSTMLNASVNEIMEMPITEMNVIPPTFFIAKSAQQQVKIKMVYVSILDVNWFFIAEELIYLNRLHSGNHFTYAHKQPCFAVNSLP